jgi:hypothetical protein
MSTQGRAGVPLGAGGGARWGVPRSNKPLDGDHDHHRHEKPCGRDEQDRRQSALTIRLIERPAWFEIPRHGRTVRLARRPHDVPVVPQRRARRASVLPALLSVAQKIDLYSSAQR